MNRPNIVQLVFQEFQVTEDSRSQVLLSILRFKEEQNIYKQPV